MPSFAGRADAVQRVQELPPTNRLSADSSGTSRTVSAGLPLGTLARWPGPERPGSPRREPWPPLSSRSWNAAMQSGPSSPTGNGSGVYTAARHAHSRSANFYEVDLSRTSSSSAAKSDPNEAFRYWWLFFRLEAFPLRTWCGRWREGRLAGSTVAVGSRDYAREVEVELKRRVFLRRGADARLRLYSRPACLRLKILARPTDEDLEEISAPPRSRCSYRLLFMLYAEEP